eukprot:scaffold12626_cov62-Phaeocystis_antarctica.AAC.3
MHTPGALHHEQRLHLVGRGVDCQGVSLREDPRGGGPLPPQVTHHAEVSRAPRAATPCVPPATQCIQPATLCTPPATLSRWAELLAVKFNEQADELGLVRSRV